ncbi:MAG: hypothetical protein IIZ38_11255 [Sphingomonas sp.]|uniref:hypothetical protein n=1 Tax=Sphingomonas sp. TaxID=28214 RepID=UPI0025DC6261|nr:hypothetical protein [Sphingomonas sp.]MBQ1498881.1 hypothetical protein [Sphingomonas sp.]
MRRGAARGAVTVVSPELIRAHATLQRGSHFLGLGLGGPGAAPRAIEGRYRAKVIGNGLRELDRFLNLLVGETARCRGIALPGGERNTANKLARLRHALRVPDPDHARLVALGRSRNCLFHCAGTVRRGDGDGEAVMTTGWHGEGGGLRRVPVGAELVLSPAELSEICLFYRDIADRLLAEARGPTNGTP